MEVALLVANQRRGKPPLSEREVREIARSVARYAPQQAIAEAAKPVCNWPSPLSEAAYQGIAGEFVRLVQSETEADPAASLFQLLVALGSIIGRGPHYRVGAERHHVNIFMVCVADSSKGRKGTNWNEVKAFCQLVDIGWYQTRIGGGLSTGEGLIHAVRDPIREQVADGQSNLLDGPSEVGSGLLREEAVPLSRLIDVVNDRFGTDFNQADQLFI
jgi:hypothetical protein